MKRLFGLCLVLAVVACTQQEAPPPAAAAPPPPVAAAPPPPPPPPAPPVTLASLDGRYSGTATLSVSGAGGDAPTNPICVNERPIGMTIHNGYATIKYQNYRSSTLHYRGRVDANGKLLVSHLNGDGSRSVFTLQLDGNGASGQMQRGRCWYDVSMTRA